MTDRENVLACLKREPMDFQPFDFQLCPALVQEYRKRTGSQKAYEEYFDFPWLNTSPIRLYVPDDSFYKKIYGGSLKNGAIIDEFGVAYEPGGEETLQTEYYMRNPMQHFCSMDQFQNYVYPEFHEEDNIHIATEIEEIHRKQKAAIGNVTTTIWERAWYMRGMMELMVDMMDGEEWASYHLDRITDLARKRADFFVKNGVDVLYLGDDIGMQSTIMMSKKLYREWIKPRLKSVIDSAKKICSDILIMYHSCGYIEPFIQDLIEIGVDILNPIQPESMNFEKIYAEYGGELSFYGTIGTQTTMPFGSVEDVKREVHKNLSIAQKYGGLFCAPTHVLEPEVPWENIMAYVDAVKNF